MRTPADAVDDLAAIVEGSEAEAFVAAARAELASISAEEVAPRALHEAAPPTSLRAFVALVLSMEAQAGRFTSIGWGHPILKVLEAEAATFDRAVAPYLAAFALTALPAVAGAYETKSSLKHLGKAVGARALAEALVALCDVRPERPHKKMLLETIGAAGLPPSPRLVRVLVRACAEAAAGTREAAMAVLARSPSEAVAALEAARAATASRREARLYDEALASLREGDDRAAPEEAPSPGGDPLAAALGAIERGDDRAALALLCDAWRDARRPEIARAIDVVGARLDAAPVRDATKAAEQRRWLTIAARDDPADLGSLLATPWPSKWKDGAERIAALAKRRPDPRVSEALLATLDPPVYDSKGSWPFWLDLWGCVLRAIRDPRARERVAALRNRPSEMRYRTPYQALDTVLPAGTAPSPDEPPAPAPSVAATLERIAGALRRDVATAASTARSREDLLAAIYADPSDDAARLVYADWLLERGDLRGELIQLQIERRAGRGSPRAARREASLLKEHREAWLGPLEPYVRREHVVFERGFPTSLAVEASDRKLTQAAELAEWATVEEILLGGEHLRWLEGETLARFVERLPALRGVHRVGHRQIAALGQLDPGRLTELGFDGDTDAWTRADGGLAALADPFEGPGFAAVRALFVGAPPFWQRASFDAWLHRFALSRRLHRLVVAAGSAALAPALAWASEHGGPDLARVEVMGRDTEWAGRPTAWHHVLTRGKGGRLSALASTWVGRTGNDTVGETTALVEALRALPEGALESVHVAFASKLAPTPEEQRAIEAVLADRGVRDVALPW